MQRIARLPSVGDLPIDTAVEVLMQGEFVPYRPRDNKYHERWQREAQQETKEHFISRLHAIDLPIVSAAIYLRSCLTQNKKSYHFKENYLFPGSDYFKPKTSYEGFLKWVEVFT
jgi:hypothetical protein